jgi:hypothetical protein
MIPTIKQSVNASRIRSAMNTEEKLLNQAQSKMSQRLFELAKERDIWKQKFEVMRDIAKFHFEDKMIGQGMSGREQYEYLDDDLERRMKP